jgi:hypothetical protein
MSFIDETKSSLDMSKSHIVAFPDLSQYTNITSLNVSHNYIYNLDVDFFPPYIKSLSLSNNHLTGCVDDVLPLTIEKLKLDNNNISKFDGSKFLNLKELSIASNNLVCFTFPPNIESLDISTNKLLKLPRFPDSLKGIACSNNLLTTLPTMNESLKCLSCNINKIEFLPYLPASLRELDASDNVIHTVVNLPNSLRCLLLSNNKLSGITCKTLNNLETLDIDNNRLQQVPLLPKNIINVNLAYNKIEEIDHSDIPYTVDKLNISYNRILEIPSGFRARFAEFEYQGNKYATRDFDMKKYGISDENEYNDDDDDYLMGSKNNIHNYFDKHKNDRYDPYDSDFRYGNSYNHESYKNLSYYDKLHNSVKYPDTYTDDNLKNPYCVSVYNTKKIVL